VILKLSEFNLVVLMMNVTFSIKARALAQAHTVSGDSQDDH
jgi:hypothetical protein